MATIGVLWFAVFMLIMMAIIILALIFWIYMLVDSIKRKYKNDNDKVVWVLVIIFLGVIGALVYYFVVKKK